MHKHTLEPSDLYGAYRHALDEAAVAWLKACRVFDKAPARTARSAGG